MSVNSATVGRPAACAVSTRECASARASAWAVMNAPLPVFTSMTSPCNPAASFLARIDAVMSGIDSTVAVTSRIA